MARRPWISTLILFLLSTALVSAQQPDPWADRFVYASPDVLAPHLAAWAPDQVAAIVRGPAESVLILDMGAGEEGTGDATLYYISDGTMVPMALSYLDSTQQVLASVTLILPAGEDGAHLQRVVGYSGSVPWRYLEARVFTDTLHLDAVSAAGYMGRARVYLPSVTNN